MPSRVLPPYLFIAAVSLSLFSGFVRASDQADYQKDIRPLLESHCFKCHGPDKQRGNVDLSPFADEKAIQSKPRLWRKAAAQLESATMPPVKQPQPTAEQRALLVQWVRRTLDAAKPIPDPGPSAVRRLDRDEYNRTIHDLLGVDFDAASAVGMIDEPTGGFEQSHRSSGNLPPSLMEKYFAAADKVLDRFAGRNDQGKPLPPNDPAAKKAAQARKTVFFVASGADLSKHNAARQILSRFLRRAYRRPVGDDEVDRCVALFERADNRGASFEEAMRLPIKAALVSPNFLYRIEQDRRCAGRIERSVPRRRPGTGGTAGVFSFGPPRRMRNCRRWPIKGSWPTRRCCISKSRGC